MFLTGWSSPYTSTTYKAEYKMSVVGPALPWGKAARYGPTWSAERTQGRINIKSPGISHSGDQTREVQRHPTG
jgi:hypothetical protein